MASPADLPGYRVQTKSHNAVAAAIAQGRADWGVAIETVARQYGLGMIPIRQEQYDFLVPESRRGSPVVGEFEALLNDQRIVARLAGCQLERVAAGQ